MTIWLGWRLRQASTEDSRAYSPAMVGFGTARGGQRVNVSRAVEWIVGAVLLVTLAAYALLGIFNRYVADDYSTVVAVRLRGFLSEQVELYRTWTGRFASSALISVAAALPEGLVRVLPGIVIAVWVWLLVLALKPILPTGIVARLILAAGVVYATLQVTPSPFMSLYWMTGSLSYVAPLLLATLLVGLICRPERAGRRRIAKVVGVAVVAFLAGGTSETYATAQTVALALATVIAASPLSTISRSKLRVLVVALLASVAALAVLAVAPGNALRNAAIVQIIGHHPALLDMPRLTVQVTSEFLGSLFSAHWASVCALVVLAALFGVRSRAFINAPSRSLVMAASAVGIGAVIVIASAIAPSIYEEGRLTNDYGQVVPVYVFVCAVATLGWIGGRGLQSLGRAAWIRRAAPTLMALSACVVVAGPIVTVAGMVGALPDIHAWADTKDAEAVAATSAHAAGGASVTVPPLRGLSDMGVFSHYPWEDLSNDPRFWINEAEATYYGVAAMTASATPPP
jgi:hypothetical protein